MTSHAAATPATVDRSVLVTLNPPEAWALFTQRLRDWWPLKSHSCSGDAQARVEFEPRVGGAVVEIAPDGRRHPWGTLAEWAPPHAFTMSWHPGQPTEQATRLRVTFTARADATEVRVQHDGWEARGAESDNARRDYDRGWPVVLRGLSEAALRVQHRRSAA